MIMFLCFVTGLLSTHAQMKVIAVSFLTGLVNYFGFCFFYFSSFLAIQINNVQF